MSINFLPSFNDWRINILENEEYQETLPLFNSKETNEPIYDKHKYIYDEYNNIVNRANNLNSLSTNKEIIDLASDCKRLQNYIKNNQIITLPSKNNFNFTDIWNSIENTTYSLSITLKRVMPSYIKHKFEWDEIRDEHVEYKIIENKNEGEDNNSIESNYDIEKHAGFSDYENDDDDNYSVNDNDNNNENDFYYNIV